jgi:hypothetical protein
MLRPHLDRLLFEEDSTGEETGLMGDDVPEAKLGDPAVVKEWALLEGRGLGGLAMAFASVRMRNRKETITRILLSLRNKIQSKDAPRCLSKPIYATDFCLKNIQIF